MDEWLEMSDEQRDAVEAAAMREHTEWWDSLTALEQYRSLRRGAVERALSYRQTILPVFPFLRDQLRQTQVSMVKAREFLRTGIYPGEA
jgi:hypothetical protein